MKLGTVAAVTIATVLAAGCGGGKSRVESADHTPPFAVDSEKLDGKLDGVILIVIDTLRADHLGCYGSDLGLSPHIDEFASRSHLFENAAATSSWTRPSIAGMLTSRYPTSLGVLDKDDKLSESAVTVAEVLQQELGTQTMAVETNDNISAEMGFSQGFDRFERPNLFRKYPGDFPISIAEDVTRRSLEILDERQPNRSFFLFSLYVDPHDPYLPHPGIFRKSTPPGRFDGSRRQLRELDRLNRRAHPEDYERIRHLYAGEVAYVDHWVGKFLEGLQLRGLAGNLMVILTSDHGEGLWTHKYRGHGNDLYQETVHVPLIVHLPGQSRRQASRISQTVSLVDLAPTILSAMGAQKPTDFQGFDLSPLFRGESRATESEPIYAEMDHRRRNMEMVQVGKVKIIRDRRYQQETNAAYEVYDLYSDPGETDNLARSEDFGRWRPFRELLNYRSLAVRAEARNREKIALEDISSIQKASLVALGYIDPSESKTASDPQMPLSDGGNVLHDYINPARYGLYFLRDSSAREKVLNGTVEGENGPLLLHVDSEIKVLLGRQDKLDHWEIEASVKGATNTNPVRTTVSVDNEALTTVAIHSPGSFLLRGQLPQTREPRVLLKIVRKPTGSHDVYPDSVSLDEVLPEPEFSIESISLR